MHPEAREGLRRMIEASGIDTAYQFNVLDLGGRDINGGIRDLIPGAKWFGVDIEPGPGVDLVHDCTTWWPHDFPRFDLVVCTEVLEHVQKWRQLLAVCGQAMADNEAQLLFITAASDRRRPHGASGALDPAPGEWYQNVSPSSLAEALERLYTYSHVEYNPNPGDVYAYASLRKPAVFSEF